MTYGSQILNCQVSDLRGHIGVGTLPIQVSKVALLSNSPHPSKREILLSKLFTSFYPQVTFVSIEYLPVMSPTEEEISDPRIFSNRVGPARFYHHSDISHISPFFVKKIMLKIFDVFPHTSTVTVQGKICT